MCVQYRHCLVCFMNYVILWPGSTLTGSTWTGSSLQREAVAQRTSSATPSSWRSDFKAVYLFLSFFLDFFSSERMNKSLSLYSLCLRHMREIILITQNSRNDGSYLRRRGRSRSIRETLKRMCIWVSSWETFVSLFCKSSCVSLKKKKWKVDHLSWQAVVLRSRIEVLLSSNSPLPLAFAKEPKYCFTLTLPCALCS